jgi:predicted ArsR family transcriptional regulator
MSKPQVKIVDVTTGEEIIRDATDEEIAKFEQEVANAVARKAEAEAKVAQRQAILDRLGLTSEEAKILLGA